MDAKLNSPRAPHAHRGIIKIERPAQLTKNYSPKWDNIVNKDKTKTNNTLQITNTHNNKHGDIHTYTTQEGFNVHHTQQHYVKTHTKNDIKPKHTLTQLSLKKGYKLMARDESKKCTTIRSLLPYRGYTPNKY